MKIPVNNDVLVAKPKTTFLQCEDCGTLAYQEDRFCSCCGTRLRSKEEEPGVCSRCEARRLHPHALFCTVCGEATQKQEHMSMLSTSAADEKIFKQ